MRDEKSNSITLYDVYTKPKQLITNHDIMKKTMLDQLRNKQTYNLHMNRMIKYLQIPS